MKKQLLLTLILASLTALLVAQSQPPPPTPSEPGNKNQQVSGDEQTNAKPTETPSEHIPPVVNQSQPQPAEKARDRDSGERGYEPPFNRWNAALVTLFTGILAILAFLQYRAMRQQADYMRDGLKITEQAADASTKSAKAAEDGVRQARETAIIDQRPWVLARGATLQRPIKAGDFVEAHITLTNAGKTPANNTRVKTWIVITNETSVEKFLKAEIGGIDSAGVVVPSAPIEEKVISAIPMKQENVDWIMNGVVTVYVFGTITYDGGSTDFCYAYIPSAASFVTYKEGNYAK